MVDHCMNGRVDQAPSAGARGPLGKNVHAYVFAIPNHYTFSLSIRQADVEALRPSGRTGLG